jgi:hypothetical protein
VTYTAGDQVGTLRTIPDAFSGNENAQSILHSLVLVNKTTTAPAMDVLLFSSAITPTSADDAAVSVTDAIMAASFLGAITVDVADWKTTAANAWATKTGLSLAVKNAAGGSSLYALFVDRTGVALAADAIEAKFGFLQD